MRIWLVTVGEPLPTDSTGSRLLRTGLQAEQLSRRGHDVLFWTSAFDHSHKKQRTDRHELLEIHPHFQIQLIQALGYRSNISLQRIKDHRHVAKGFRQLAPLRARPDVIVCSLPTLELGVAVTQYAVENQVPVILDVRDMWPDCIVDLVPKPGRPVARVALDFMYRDIQTACSQATAITGITKEYVRWAMTYASRPPTSWDRPFPLAYSQEQPGRDEIEQADTYWKLLGLNPEAGDFIACFFGTFSRQFEFDTLITAARLLENNLPQFKMVLCGDGPMRRKSLRSAQGHPNVLLPGWVNSAQIWSLSRMASVGLAPYRSTPDFTISYPNKPIEYLSAGLPVISSLQGVLAELLDENDCGITYANGDPQELASVIRNLSESPQRLEQLSQNARNLYQHRFVAETVYDQFHDYLLELAGASETKRLAA